MVCSKTEFVHSLIKIKWELKFNRIPVRLMVHMYYRRNAPDETLYKSRRAYLHMYVCVCVFLLFSGRFQCAIEAMWHLWSWQPCRGRWSTQRGSWNNFCPTWLTETWRVKTTPNCCWGGEGGVGGGKED